MRRTRGGVAASFSHEVRIGWWSNSPFEIKLQIRRTFQMKKSDDGGRMVNTATDCLVGSFRRELGL